MSAPKTVRIAHIADLHLNASPDMDEAFRCLEFALETAIARGCATIIIAGDVWDKTPSLKAIRRLQNTLKIAKDAFLNPILDQGRIVMLYGNHDPSDSLDILGLNDFSVYSRPDSVMGIPFAGSENIEDHSFLTFLPYPTKANLMQWAEGSQDQTDLVAVDILRKIIRGFAAEYADNVERRAFSREPDTTPPVAPPHILVYHGNVTGAETATGQVLIGGDIMLSARDLEESGADYVACGHIHLQQAMSDRVHYSGSTWNVNFGETDKKYMLIVDVTRGELPVIERVELPTTPKYTVEIEIDANGKPVYDMEAVDVGTTGANVKVRYRISQEQAATFDEEVLRGVAYMAKSVIFERIIQPKERVRCESIAEQVTLADKVAAWGESVEIAIPEGVTEKAVEVETAVGGVR